jgi:hypothetical protein
MTPEEKNLISGLFDRLAQANTQAKDAEAEELIRSRVAQNPSAAYLLAQSTLVMQQALANAQTRIADLDKQLNEAKAGQKAPPSGGSFLSGVASFFGAGSSQAQPQPPSSPPPIPRPAGQTPPPPPVAQHPQQGYGYAPPPPPQYATAQPSGGGFLQSALTTAAGVAGGALLFRGIENLIGHNPGPFGGAVMPGGGFMPSGPQEVVNNYYTEGTQAPGEQRVADQGDPDPDSQYVADQGDPDPDSQYVADQGDPDSDDQYTDTTDYGSGDDFGGDSGGDDNFV